MGNIYDVIVVGAGQTGTHCARKLAQKGFKVIILERQNEIGEPNFSTAGTTADTLARFDLPKELAPYKWSNFVLSTPSVEKNFNMKNHSGYVLDFRKLRQWLAEDAAHKGAEVAVGCEATGLKINEGRVTGVKYKGIISSGELSSKIVINAAGNNASLAKDLDLVHTNGGIIASGLELELMDVNLPVKDALYCWLGDKFIPNGYAWVFPLTATKVKVGIGRYMLSTKPFELKHGLKKFIEDVPWLATGEPLEFHGGSLSFNSSDREHTRDGFIDLSNIANPLGGEGIRHGLQAAEYASEVCEKALKDADCSVRVLRRYDQLWLDYSDHNWKTCQQIAKFIYSNTEDGRMDRYLSDSSYLTGDDWYEVLFNYQFQKQAKDFLRSALVQNASKFLNT